VSKDGPRRMRQQIIDLSLWRKRRQEKQSAQRTLAQVERLYQAYLRVCIEAGLRPNPPKRSR
jgi:hypothetical protein